MPTITFAEIHARLAEQHAEIRPAIVVTPKGRIDVLLRQVERIVLLLDAEARMEVYDRLDRLSDLCSARDPRAV